MTTLEAIVGATTYNLSNGSLSFRVSEVGLGLPPLTRYSRRGPRQHGTTDTGYRLEPRLLQFGFVASLLTRTDYYTRRSDLMEIFTPSDDPILLRWTLENGAVRQIDAFYNGGLDFAAAAADGLLMRMSIELYCPDPTFYDPTLQTVTFTNSAWLGGMAVPLAVPLAVGNSTFDTTTTIAYTGSWPSYPTIRITGPITSPTITNTATNETIPLTANGGAIIAAGTYWDINLASGQKIIVDSVGTNMIQYLADANDLATFHLAPSPEVASGNNPIRMTGSGADGLTSLRVEHYRRYVGL